MDYVIRDIREDEFPLLQEFLYQAIWVPENFEGEVPRSVIYDDLKCRAAFEGFGSLPDDRALAAEVGGASNQEALSRPTGFRTQLWPMPPGKRVFIRPFVNLSCRHLPL